jgi:anaerobic glycerol-3-phosphate dehydrogenase
MSFDSVVMGGRGHVGTLLAIIISSRGVKTAIVSSLTWATPRLIFS